MSKLYYSLFATLFLSGLYALRSDIETYVSEIWVGKSFGYVYKACTTNGWFNFLFALTLICLFATIGKNVYHSKGNTLRCISCSFAIVYLLTNNHWIFPKVLFIDADYGSFLIISLIAILILDITALAREYLSIGNSNANDTYADDKKGYCMDGVYSELRETGWDNYVSNLLTLMPHSRLKKESLAIGISGNWGSGKTSFLKSMQKQMDADYRVVSFNPWTCTDKEQIISQFFALMSNQTEDNNNESLQEAIQKYRDIVLDTDIHPSLTFLAKILPMSKREETIDSLKAKIEKVISADDSKPFAVFIDDLDRLEGNELFEVLRLIRITANFRNVVFIVAYDRDYICNVLNESKNIKRAEEYIQKIFHLEVSLPKFEEETLLEVFMEEIVRIAALNESNASILKRSIRQLLDADGLSFTDYVPNFRQARRFANVFAVNLKSIISHTKDFVTKDFVGIELLHFAFPDIHRTLMYKPMTLLKQRPATLSKARLLVYESDNNTPCDRLLKRLFPNDSETEKSSREIRSQISFANYFCYRLPQNVIGATEFEMLMIGNDVDEVRKNIQEWSQKDDSRNSLYEHFRSYYMHGYQDVKVMRNYMCALLEFLPWLTKKGITEIMSERYWIRTGVDINDLQRQIISLFEYYIRRGEGLKNINYLLSAIYYAYPEDYEPDEMASDLLEEEQLIMLADKSLAKYIEMNGKPSPNEISDKNSSFNRFLKSGCYVRCYYLEGGEYVGTDTNLMCHELINQYEGTKANMDIFQEFISPYLIKTDNPAEEEYEAQSIKNEIYSIFDSYTLFEKFVRGTFCMNEDIEKSLEYIRNL